MTGEAWYRCLIASALSEHPNHMLDSGGYPASNSCAFSVRQNFHRLILTRGLNDQAKQLSTISRRGGLRLHSDSGQEMRWSGAGEGNSLAPHPLSSEVPP